MIFFISDTHFGHKNIIQYSNRPFSSVEEMDNTLVRNWNNRVRPFDTVWVLGDFSFASADRTTMLLSLLNGYKYLIRGNHDSSRSETFWKKAGFKEVFKNPVTLDRFLLSHEPVSNKSLKNIHGHTHTKALYTDWQFSVCVEAIGYAPISLDEIIEQTGWGVSTWVM